MPHLPPGRSAGRVREAIERERSAGTLGGVQERSEKSGCKITRTKSSARTEGGGVQRELSKHRRSYLAYAPSSQREAPLTARLAPQGWTVFTRTEAVKH